MLILLSFQTIAGTQQPIFVQFDELLVEASIQENTKLLRKITSEITSINATYYRGRIRGFAESQLRLSEKDGYWRGVLLHTGRMYQLSGSSTQNMDSIILTATFPKMDSRTAQYCGQGIDLVETEQRYFPIYQVDSSLTETEIVTTAVVAGATSLCANPVDGVCLMPKIEFAYDLSYQTLPSLMETPLERAVREINVAEMFLERSLGFRFSQLSLTMLDSTQDAQINSTSSLFGSGASAVLNGLRTLRSAGDLSFLQESRSIFHFVTGRDFSPTADGTNIVGIAYPAQSCQLFGLNTGLTDAGDIDEALVSLVMAHEIGHNLGAAHDSLTGNGCDANAFVMAPSIGGNGFTITEFSSCSIDAISIHVAQKMDVGCFDFPIDVSVDYGADNLPELAKNQSVGIRYDLSIIDSNKQVGRLVVEGSIPNVLEGEFVGVNLPNGDCIVGVHNFSCVISSPVDNIQLEIGVFIFDASSQFTVDIQSRSETIGTIDLNSSNDEVSMTFSSFSSVPVPEFVPTDSSATNNTEAVATFTSSGGGGSTGALSFLALTSIFLYRKRGFFIISGR